MGRLTRLLAPAAAAPLGKLAKSSSGQQLVFNLTRLNKPEISNLLADDSIRFLSYCISRRTWSKSQIMQDLWVCYELGESADGYFVEFGSTNGLKNSNTWLLEKKLGWKGILAEPNPVWHAELLANRTAHIEQNCVYSHSDDIVSFIATDGSDPELSAIERYSEGDHFADVRKLGRKIEVKTISLDDLLDKYDAPETIDYISIDTEGSELAILAAHSFRRKFKLLSVEINRNTETEIDALLQSNGYERKFKHFSQWDAWYVSAELQQAFRTDMSAPEA